MRTKTIEKLVREYIAKELSTNVEKIQLDDNLINDLHADSMDIVNIVTAIESRFKITFPNDTEIRYEGYTPRFLVEGTQRALALKNPVRKAALKAEVRAEKTVRRVRKTEEAVENKVEPRKKTKPATKEQAENTDTSAE